MDYPKSVPGVGLVGGKFVDENTATGQQGSLIPSVWGNAVTEEISNVIKDAGDVPAEGDLSQLQKAIRKIVALVWPKASDVEVAAGVVDDKVVTPKKLRAGFSGSFGANGFIAFPTWMGGLIVQWCSVSVTQNAAGSENIFSWPLTYPNYLLAASATMISGGSTTFSMGLGYLPVSASQGKITVGNVAVRDTTSALVIGFGL